MLNWLSSVIKYWFNDPSTPELTGQLILPAQTAGAQIAVQGFTGQGGPDDSPQQQAAQCYLSMTESLNYAKQFVGDRLMGGFHAPNPLPVYPRYGTDWNAFYDRSAIKLFYNTDPVSHKVIYTCDSAEVCTHELGHAILDALRYDLWNYPFMEVWSLHESFGDINAMLHGMYHDEVIDHMLAETGSNLRRSNVVSKCGEEMGTGIYDATGGRAGHIGVLRDAVNSFTYTPPEHLPSRAGEDQLASEPHSFSRVFTAAWYDMFVGIYELLVSQGKDGRSAVKQARDICATYTFKALTQAPVTTRFYNSVAQAIILIDKQQGGVYQSQIHNAFANRFIASQLTMFTLPAASQTSAFVALADHQAPSDKWKGIQVEVPVHLTFAHEGTPKLGLEQTLAVTAAINYLEQNEMDSFRIEDGKLLRNYFSCDCFINNSTLPGNPEYGKGYKPENNSGCCFCKPRKEEPKPKIKRGCYIRYNSGCGQTK